MSLEIAVYLQGTSFDAREIVATNQQLDMEFALSEYQTQLLSTWQKIVNSIARNISRDFQPQKEFVPISYTKQVANILTSAMLLAYLIGRFQIKSHIQLTQTEELHLEEWRPDYALQSMLQKRVVHPEVFNILADELKARAFTIAHVTNIRALEIIKRKLAEHIAQGKTLADFRSSIAEILQGDSELPFWHLETVWRTNVQSAYHFGRWYEIQSLREHIWGLEYHAILDERTRPSHERMHGFIAPVDDPIWYIWFPPNGYNCRCSVVPITYAEARRARLRYSRHPNLNPDEGFANAPDILSLPRSVYQIARIYRIPLPHPTPPFNAEDLWHRLSNNREVYQLLLHTQSTNPVAYRYLCSNQNLQDFDKIIFSRINPEVLGFYSNALIKINSDYPLDELKEHQVLAHELAHHLYSKLAVAQKEKIKKIYEKHVIALINRVRNENLRQLLSQRFRYHGTLGEWYRYLEIPPEWPRAYAYYSPQEFWAVCIESLPQLSYKYPRLYNQIVKIMREAL